MNHPLSPSGPHRIKDIAITPVAFRDPPLLNAVGVHEPFALRAIVEITTDTGFSGLGETYGDAPHLSRLQLAAEALAGTDVFNINEMRQAGHQSPQRGHHRRRPRDVWNGDRLQHP
ncbi:hypothetical protein [Arthrobacter globiformis]|uniref:hypothetical protein n=1 Tax=Arthrobacter globiformis TaxID=1665 RepID=UPI002781A97A|nr:hypothetical protein [Arthrobacter globiformis]MDQ0862731.1 L-alanine-DL-glutamate epimerase-like enolase superfamily enzyme [Arthrobacter globiformis]